MKKFNSATSPVFFTFDLEDHRTFKDPETSRYQKNTENILEWLNDNKISSTFFIVGDLAERSPNLIKKIAQYGHDIAFHSYKHKPLTLDLPKDFKKQTEYGKKLLEDLSSKRVIGFRAPCFSLTKNTTWVIDLLTSLGFEYSSSIIPTNAGKYCFPGVPQEPFIWKGGLVEYPMVLSKFLGKSFPSIGGLYIRIYPAKFSIKTLNKVGIPWTHVHPQDFDFDEPFTLVENLSFFESYVYRFNRKTLLKKFNFLLDYLSCESLEKHFKSLKKEELEEINYTNV